MLTGNRIWKVRLADVGIAAGKTVEAHALTGVLVRGSGIKKDLRILGYGCPIELGFDVVTGVKGDCLDRYLVRLNECLESARIIQQCMKSLKVFTVLHNYRETISNLHDRKVGTPDKYEFGTNMESMIHYFKLVTEGCTLPKGRTYVRQEAPKGELGLYIVSDNANKPHRVKTRSPDYYNSQALNLIAHNHLLADLIAILGTVDPVLGSVDR